MSKLDISGMSIDELKQLQKELFKAFSFHQDRQKAEARAKAEAVAREYGFSLSDLLLAKSKSRRSPVCPKYQHPEDPLRTWSGRGRKPQWFHEALASGKTPEDLAIS